MDKNPVQILHPYSNVTISCTDRINRGIEYDFVNEAFQKFSNINEEVGLTKSDYVFPKENIYVAIRKSFSERQSPRELFGHIVFDWHNKIVEVWTGEYSDSIVKKELGSPYSRVINIIKIFSGIFLDDN